MRRGFERLVRYRRRTRRLAGALLFGTAVAMALVIVRGGQHVVGSALVGLVATGVLAGSVRSPRRVSWIGVATMVAVVVGVYTWSDRVLARYPLPTQRAYRMDDYRLAWEFRRRRDWTRPQVVRALAIIAAQRSQHPERLPELAVAEMQVWRRALEARLVAHPDLMGVLDRWTRRDWVAEVRPALAVTARDVHEICGTPVRFLYRPLLALSCRHEDRHLADIDHRLRGLSGSTVAGWPRFDPVWVQDLEQAMNRHAASPLVHDLVVREAVGFFKVAMKLHLWRRFAWFAGHRGRPPPDPFHPRQEPLEWRAGEIRSVSRVRFRLP